MRRGIGAFTIGLFLPVLVDPVRADLPIDWPLNQAVIAGDLDRLRALLASTEQTQKELDYALVAAAGKGQAEAARILLAAGADPNFRVPEGSVGYTSIIVATRENQPEVLGVLLAHGGDPNIQDALKWRPLHHAVSPSAQYLHVIRVLIAHGADVDGRDGLQRTALHRAAGFGHAKAVKLLLQNGADAALREKYGRTARERAARAGHHAVARLLGSARKGIATLPSNELGTTNKAPMLHVDRQPREMILSIIINWLYGLLPAVVLRYVIIRRPLRKGAALAVTIPVALLLLIVTTGLAHLAGVSANMAPVAIWTLITYWILQTGRRISPAG